MKTILLLLAVIAVAHAGVTLTLLSDDIEAFLKTHNDVRNALGIPSLTWDTKLADYAKDWTSGCVFEHSTGNYGENLFGSDPLNDNATALAYESAISWKSELADVDPDWECIGREPTCGHYSQMVWRDTTAVGCAITHCDNMPNLVSCNYDPPGNYEGEEPY
ncbi:uncharacterized protein LOC131951149 isoform X2 [Physella acuta]|uniref:uncharacterized protein LOC131951149 isoform X2 n=1 Tax=Physella acuta TaxID=109671 RepID=UPI0027DB15CF|nr:uncharacterized protein LOC131951149 isoform X2 [Physella acuta]